jgi:hypothetical protein
MVKKLKFEVLRGSHRIGSVRDKNNRVLVKGRNVKAGGVVESNIDLVEKFASEPPKYRRVDVVVEAEKDLESELRQLTKTQLIERAEAQEIDLSDCHSKDAMIKRLLETQSL